MERYSLKRSMQMLALMLGLSAAVGTYAYAQKPKDVTLVIDGEKKEVFTAEKTVHDVLKEEGFTAFEGTTFSVDENAPVADGLEIRVDSLKRIELTVNGVRRMTETHQNSVNDFLKEAKVSYDANDIISPARSQKLEDGMGVTVDRIDVTQEKVTEEIPFETKTEKTDELYEGDSDVSQEGVPGQLERTVKVTRRNGKVESRETVKETVVKKPVDKIVREGTAERPAMPGGLDPSEVAYTMVMEATAYTHSGEPTASGAWPQVNYTVAVDPNVIPLGTRMYVEGYGYAVAQDTGGAIKGNIIDVFLDSEAACESWGRRMVVVHILK